MNCNPILIMQSEQEKLKALFPHASASTLKRNPEFGSAMPKAGYAAPSSLCVSAKLKQQNKYRNVKVEYQGMMFDSGHELKCWKSLVLLEKAGVISNLKRQVRFELEVNGKRTGKITVDFTWMENGQSVIADAKSEITRKERSYRMQKRHFEAQYEPLTIREL